VRSKVVVIGGGLAGLYVASLARDLGMNAVVLEARPDCGGRVKSVPASVLQGWDIDLGGELIGPGHVKGAAKGFRKSGARASNHNCFSHHCRTTMAFVMDGTGRPE